jgi:DNA-binding XRE family transcriptional regulator
MIPNFSTVWTDGKVTGIVVPVDEFQRLTGYHVDPAGHIVMPHADDHTFEWSPSTQQLVDAENLVSNPATTWHSADDILAEIVADGLKHLREKNGMTQTQLAKALDVTQPHVSKLEQTDGLDGAPLRLLRKMAQVFFDRSRASQSLS